MNCTRIAGANALLSRQSASHLLPASNGTIAIISTAGPGLSATRNHRIATQRPFSTSKPQLLRQTKPRRMREFFPEPDTPHIRRTAPAWHHPVYTEAEMNAVAIAHREAKTWSDYAALGAVKLVRGMFDLVSGYRHDKAVALNKKDPAAAKQKYAMTERKYMIRNIFLESVAGE